MKYIIFIILIAQTFSCFAQTTFKKFDIIPLDTRKSFLTFENKNFIENISNENQNNNSILPYKNSSIEFFNNSEINKNFIIYKSADEKINENGISKEVNYNFLQFYDLYNPNLNIFDNWNTFWSFGLKQNNVLNNDIKIKYSSQFGIGARNITKNWLSKRVVEYGYTNENSILFSNETSKNNWNAQKLYSCFSISKILYKDFSLGIGSSISLDKFTDKTLTLKNSKNNINYSINTNITKNLSNKAFISAELNYNYGYKTGLQNVGIKAFQNHKNKAWSEVSLSFGIIFDQFKVDEKITKDSDIINVLSSKNLSLKNKNNELSDKENITKNKNLNDNLKLIDYAISYAIEYDNNQNLIAF